MATYRIKNATPNKFDELARISHNLRHFSKIWKEQYGAENRKMMAYWENKMDTWLQENIDYTAMSNTEEYYSNFNAKWTESENKPI